MYIEDDGIAYSITHNDKFTLLAELDLDDEMSVLDEGLLYEWDGMERFYLVYLSEDNPDVVYNGNTDDLKYFLSDMDEFGEIVWIDRPSWINEVLR